MRAKRAQEILLHGAEREVETVRIPADGVTLTGDLVVPTSARGLVVFAHGSGSSRTSPRNRQVAAVLNEGGYGTLLFDLLTTSEEAVDAATGHLRFDIDLLARRLVAAIDWTAERPSATLPMGLFGASTGGAAALEAAAERPDRVKAVVSRGGRPDLALEALDRVKAPTLLVVGGADTEVIRLNEIALARLTTEKQLVLVKGATHLFEEPGALDEVARLALGWFERFLAVRRQATGGAREEDGVRRRERGTR
jgi:dienelactone hydrolase